MISSMKRGTFIFACEQRRISKDNEHKNETYNLDQEKADEIYRGT